MTDRDLTRRRVLALSGAAVGAALGIGLSSCSADPEPGRRSGSGSGSTRSPKSVEQPKPEDPGGH
ncbi:twin-arginine translocation signal domain-containing protein [Streptomyces sp. NPDC054766]|uniref:twin-arginine translocation signal domain-containing protein n=1 Tax=Streptomyces rhizosphaerihabitans TaxID=1266770 RepID=UPI0021C15F46|nr:twin-arginine translocation signal domain-containing protein [Streptomyces rhizosphaerihabitans]MCT9004154.1 twin-arginine translocation signal domain-containing protein [Streptomyces rhizosphaerihabitans]